MKRIPLASRRHPGYETLVDDRHYPDLSQFEWRLVWKKNRHSIRLYAARYGRVGGKLKVIFMHREILKAPDGIEVDHHNDNGLDNQEHNLRFATHAQNRWNLRKGPKKTSSKYKGVSWNKQAEKWEARICVKGKNEFLGQFKKEVDAAIHYNVAAQIFYGEFARLNPV